MIGLETDVVKLIPYTVEWNRFFEKEKDILTSAIGEYVLDIQHVGSTSISGMVAKPIIDIAVAVANFEEARVCIGPIEQLGYEYRGEHGIPRRHYFVKDNPRTHHLHMNEVDSLAWQDHILFRDYLTENPDVAGEYAALKLRLAQRYKTDREAYQAGKDPFIEKVLSKARAGNAGPRAEL
jgi:GrpB-like predicted nucleotidyltransferase (UPF0157 family)